MTKGPSFVCCDVDNADTLVLSDLGTLPLRVFIASVFSSVERHTWQRLLTNIDGNDCVLERKEKRRVGKAVWPVEERE